MKRMKRNALKGIILNRTVGVEVEGYTGAYSKMVNNRVRHSILKYDGSLTGGNERIRGIEVVTEPINNLDLLDEVFEDITKYDWNCGRGTAGTHIHVDAHDFYLEDKIKMAIFMNMIEKAMFLLVKKYRWFRRRYTRNQYCQSIDSRWKIFMQKLDTYHADIDWRKLKKIGNLHYELSIKRNRQIFYPNTTRYQFVNIWSSSHNTIEFRIFHAIRTAKDAKMFALLAYHLVELVKNSTLEHLEYLANGIMNDSINAEDMVNRLCQAVGLDFTFKIQNKELQARVDREKSSRAVAV